MNKFIKASLCAILAATTGATAWADSKEKAAMMTPPSDSKQFAMAAAEGGILEVKLAQLAQQKAATQEVKDLAKKIEADHTAANQKLMEVAKQQNIDLPTDLKGESKEIYDAFESLNGGAFDSAYLLVMIKDHLHDIMLFKNESEHGTVAEVKAWAAQTLPALEDHAHRIGVAARSAGIPVDVVAGSMTGDGHGAVNR